MYFSDTSSPVAYDEQFRI